MSSWLGPVLEIGGSLIGGYLQYDAARDATEAGEDSSRAQLDFARETRDIIRQDNAPYQQAGYNALNALNVLTGLPQVDTTGSSIGGPGLNSVYGDGNTPLGQAGIIQTFQDVFGRNPDQEGIQHYLTQGPKEGEAGSATNGALYGAAAGSSFGPIGAAVGGVAGAILGGDDDRERRAYTANELMHIHRNSEEYQLKKEAGELPPWEDPGYGSRNYGKINFTHEDNQALYGDQIAQRYADYQESQQAPQGSPGGPGNAMTAADLVKQDPSYQFRLDEGMDALDASASAKGGVLSGGAIRAATRYAQNYASTEYSNIYNRLSNIAGLGQTAQSSTTGAALTTGGYAHSALENQGYYNASGYAARGNALSNTLGDIGDIFQERGWI